MAPRRSSPSPAPSRRPAPLVRALVLGGALLLGAVLAGCGEDAEVEEPSAPAATISARRAAPQEMPAVTGEDPTRTPSAAEQEADEVTDPAADPAAEPVAATRVHGIWPDADWEIVDLPGDACAGTLPEETPWAIGEDFFRCGSAQKRLLVCRASEGGEPGEALCVRDPLSRSAARIRSSMLVGFTSPAAEMPYPLVVVLADGTLCGAVPRDDVEHRGGRQSWIHCGGGSALLLDQSTATQYFDREGPVWTAELEVPGHEPTRVEVREVLYAGTQEDLQEWGFTVGLGPDGAP